MINRGRDWTYSEACGCLVMFFHKSDFQTSRMLLGLYCEDHIKKCQCNERQELMERAKQARDSFDKDSRFMFTPMTCGDLIPEDREPG